MSHPAVLLDLDRTLVDVQSFTDYDTAWRDVLAVLGQAVEEHGPETGWTAATRACMALLGQLPAGDQWYAVSETIAGHERAAVGLSRPMPGVAAFLEALSGVPVAVVTLLPQDVARQVLERHGLGVDAVVGRDPLVRPKPAGDGLRRALELLGASSDGCHMVGDSAWDAAAAREAGVGFIGVHSPCSEFSAFPEAPVAASLAAALPHLRPS
ncbi:HAD family hydrolase [Nocardioides sp.]|uniref:HAD family hydrolase n=1 Tax=Nocardioides sp. TaxID=35761 RepID=UPI003528C42B